MVLIRLIPFIDDTPETSTEPPSMQTIIWGLFAADKW